MSRLECMQTAVDTHLKRVTVQKPNAIVLLIAFNNEVNLIGDGASHPVVITGTYIYFLLNVRSSSMHCILVNFFFLYQSQILEVITALKAHRCKDTPTTFDLEGQIQGKAVEIPQNDESIQQHQVYFIPVVAPTMMEQQYPPSFPQQQQPENL